MNCTHALAQTSDIFKNDLLDNCFQIVSVYRVQSKSAKAKGQAAGIALT